MNCGSGNGLRCLTDGVASCDVHLCKPEPEIYTTLMQKCNLAYDESIFVDDNKINAQAAYNLGITGILYKNPKSFRRALGPAALSWDNFP